MTVTEARPIADAIIQLVAAALEAPLRQQAMTAGGNGAVSQIAIKAEIERSLTDPALGPQALLDTFGITRSTLYRLFEPSGGVAAYIAKRRLRLAFRRITDPAESGFATGLRSRVQPRVGLHPRLRRILRNVAERCKSAGGPAGRTRTAISALARGPAVYSSGTKSCCGR
jgi:AraC-like DNA-binding protein